MPQRFEAGNVLYFIQTVAMKVQHLKVWHHKICSLFRGKEWILSGSTSGTRLLTVIWLRKLARATFSNRLLSKLNNFGCGFNTGSMLRTSPSRTLLPEGAPSLCLLRSGNSVLHRTLKATYWNKSNMIISQQTKHSALGVPEVETTRKELTIISLPQRHIQKIWCIQAEPAQGQKQTTVFVRGCTQGQCVL